MKRFQSRSRCESVQSSLADFFDGSLSAALRGPLLAHLDRCPSCRAAFERERAFRDLLADMDTLPAPAQLEEHVLGAVFAQVPLRERVRPRAEGARLRPVWALLPVALLVLVIALGQWLRPVDTGELRDTATLALVEGGREISGAIQSIEEAREVGEQITAPAFAKAASLIRVERTLLSVVPGNLIAMILLVAVSPLVLVFTVFRLRLRGALSHVLAHPSVG